MLDLRIHAGGRAIAAYDLPAIMGARRAYQEIGDQVEAMIAILDQLAGEPDDEDDEDRCGADDDLGTVGAKAHGKLGLDCPVDRHCEDAEGTWAEWHTLPSSSRRAGKIDGRPINALCDAGDDIEANGDEADHSNLEDDFIKHLPHIKPGCWISDPGEVDDHNGVDFYPDPVRHGIDQTKGIVNEYEILLAHRACG